MIVAGITCSAAMACRVAALGLVVEYRAELGNAVREKSQAAAACNHTGDAWPGGFLRHSPKMLSSRSAKRGCESGKRISDAFTIAGRDRPEFRQTRKLSRSARTLVDGSKWTAE